jgi:hypothetical protein
MHAWNKEEQRDDDPHGSSHRASTPEISDERGRQTRYWGYLSQDDTNLVQKFSQKTTIINLLTNWPAELKK